jgi:hypothetical protein
VSTIGHFLDYVTLWKLPYQPSGRQFCCPSDSFRQSILMLRRCDVLEVKLRNWVGSRQIVVAMDPLHGGCAAVMAFSSAASSLDMNGFKAQPSAPPVALGLFISLQTYIGFGPPSEARSIDDVYQSHSA